MTMRTKKESLRALLVGAACAAGLGCNGCGTSTGAALDATRADVDLDASTEGCEPLELGLCTLAGTSPAMPCVGAFDEVGEFTPVRDGTLAALVTGPQGPRMMVLAARTRGIEPGDLARPASSANPIVEVVVLDEHGAEVSSYRGRAGFAPDPAGSDWLVQPEIFVVMDGALPGAVRVHATLTDRVGAVRCGALALTMP